MRQLSQRALGGVVGGTMLVLGIAMLVLAKAPVQVVVSLAATGLLVSGAGRILGVRDAGPWRARWLDVVLGAGLLVAGVVALAWRTASLRLLAWVLAGALVASGVSALVQAWRAPRSRRAEEAFAGIPGSERAAGVFGGLATVLLGGLVLVWPRLSLVAFALVVGVWLTFSGLGMLVAARWPAARRSGHTSFVADDGGSHRASAAVGDPGPTSDDVRGRAAARPATSVAAKGPASRKRPRSVARRQLSLVGATGSFIVAVALAAGTIALHHLDPREEPDAFYTPPLSVPAEPGRLIRAEALAADRVPTGLRGWRILYTSSDGDGAPTVVSGTVLAPPADAARSGVGDAGVLAPPADAARPGAEEVATEGPTSGEPGAVGSGGEGSGDAGSDGDGSGDEAPGARGARPVLSIAHGTTGIVPRCAPSLAADPFADGASEALEQLVRDGWVGVISDYVGLGTRAPHGYLVGPDAARNVLDATRAAREIGEVELSEQTVVWGHSQGGHGALWTGIEAPAYAPELEVLGVAAFAPAADLLAIADGVRDTSGGKLVSAYLAASWSKFYGLDLAELLTPGYEGIVSRIEGHCFDGANVLGALAIASQLTAEVFRPEAWDSDLVDLLRATTPTDLIEAPVLVAQRDADQLAGLPATSTC